MNKKSNGFALAALLICIVFWGSIPLFLRYFTAYLDAWTVNGIRYGTAALLLTPLLRRRRCGKNPGSLNPWREAVIPSLVNVVGQVGYALMPYYMTASVMGFGIRSSFLFTLLACLWLLPEEHYLFRSPLFWMGSVVCIGGVAALFQGSLKEADASAPGLLIMLGSAGVWGFYGVTVRKYLRGFTPQRCFAVISLYTAAILIALMLIFGRVASLRLLSPIQLGLLLISAVIGVAFAHILMFYVLSHLGPVIESGAEMLTPFFTFCGAALIFGEHMSLIQWCGGVGVVAGCLLMICVSKPKDAVESGIE